MTKFIRLKQTNKTKQKTKQIMAFVWFMIKIIFLHLPLLVPHNIIIKHKKMNNSKVVNKYNRLGVSVMKATGKRRHFCLRLSASEQ